VVAGVWVPPEPFLGGATHDSVICEKGRNIMGVRVNDIVRSKYVDFQANVYISIECNKNSGTQFKSLKDIIDIYCSNARAFC
jgi:hypothetical protein